VRSEVAIGSAPIPFLADLLREVENDGNRQNVELACQSDERFPRVRLYIRSVDDGQSPSSKPLSDDEVQYLKRFLR
jgi:hypothetical protein